MAPPPNSMYHSADPLRRLSSSVPWEALNRPGYYRTLGKSSNHGQLKHQRLSLCFTHFVPSFRFRRVERPSFGACPQRTYVAFQATRALALCVRVRWYCFVFAFSSYGSTTDSFGLLGFENRRAGPHMRPPSFRTKMFAVSRRRHSTFAQSPDH